MDNKYKVVAFTFDDGPNSTTTVELLDLFEQYNGKASFFLIGDNINCETEPIVKRAYDMGCDICNHTKSHRALSELSETEIHNEIEYVNNQIKRITGEYPKFYRAPYGAMNELSIRSIELVSIGGYFTKDWLDYVDSDTRAKYIQSNVHDGCIMAMHDFAGNKNTVEAIRTVLPILAEQGYRFVNLTDLFKKKNIVPDEGLRPDQRRCYTYAEQKEPLHYNVDPVILTLGEYSGQGNEIFPGGPAFTASMAGILTGTIGPIMAGNLDTACYKAVMEFKDRFYGVDTTYLKTYDKEFSILELDESIFNRVNAMVIYDDSRELLKVAKICKEYRIKLFIIDKKHSKDLLEIMDQVDTIFEEEGSVHSEFKGRTVKVPDQVDIDMYAGSYTAFYMTFGDKDYAAQKAVNWYKSLDRRILK